MVQVLGAPSRPDRDPVDLVVQPVQEETQELLSVLLAVTHTRARAEGGGHTRPLQPHTLLCSGLVEEGGWRLTCNPQIWERISGSGS